jgi:carboxypeptidase Q
MLRSFLPRFLVLALLFAYASPALAQAPTEADKARLALDQRILDDAKKGSQLLTNLTYLSDIIGPRLTGSSNLKRASEWGAAKMKEYGLDNVKLEAWTIPEGWKRGHAHARLLDPDNGRTISIASMGWSPGTGGKVECDVVIIKAETIAELDQYKGKLKGAVVLSGPPTKLPTLEDGYKPKGGMGPGGGKGLGGKGKSFEEMMALRKARSEFLRKEGAIAIFQDSSKHFGLLNMTGSWSGKDRPSASAPIATAFVAHNHYEMLWRLASRPEPARTRIELDINNSFIPGPIIVHNVIGEVKGSEKSDEVIVVGAHLDSWDLGQGTTDNGTGTCIVLESARLLARCGTPPKRTIRFILFTGEEQGLHGSAAYVKQHKDEMTKVSACIVHDTGTGKVVGLGSGQNPSVKELLENELASLKPLGLTDFASRSGGGSDHMSFQKAGVPGFALKQDVTTYFLFTHHSQADTLDSVREADLIQGAQVTAVAAMRIANLDQLLLREAQKKEAKKQPGE